MPPKPADGQTLPSKEQAMFRTLVKQYEGKMYKKGVKTADTILRKFPEHGETMAMKGLVLSHLDRKTEAYDLVKRGLKANLRSHVCWHVYGLLYRSDREYDEAIKCYKNALRMDPDNSTVLRDLAQLQVHMRDLQGYLESRQTMLEGRPNNRQNWVSFAVAHHLCGNYDVAAKVLNSYENTLEEGANDAEAYEQSEVLLYKAWILEEGGMLAASLEALEQAEDKGLVRDILGGLEARGRLFLGMQRYSEAEQVYRRLLRVNPENHRYHHGLRAAVQLVQVAPAVGAAAGEAPAAAFAQELPGEELARLKGVYGELGDLFPRSSSVRRMPLDFLQGGEFVAAADSYVRPYLTKGIPSLFSDLKPLYSDPAKAAALGELFTRLEASLRETGAFPPAATNGAAPGAAAAASPQALLWTLMYLAQHHDRLGHTGEALAAADACLAHTPTLIEAYMVRAKVLKHAGDLEGAAQAAERARCMDLADRFVNSVAAKALFRAGHVEQAERTVALFLKEGDGPGALYEMQATWYEVAAGRAYLGRGDRGRALKRFLKVDSHFTDFVEDQFDFHAYCARKQTMRTYVELLRAVDRQYAQPVYGKAMAGAITTYLSLHDTPASAAAAQEEAAATEGMSADEAKRWRQRKRKEEAKREKEAAEVASKKGVEKGADAKTPEPDPDGVELVATADPLGEATKYVRQLVQGAPHRLETHTLAFEVYRRKGRLLLAARAVKAAAALAGAAHPQVHRAVVALAQAATAAGAIENGGSAAVARQVLQAQVAALLGGQDVAAYHAQWVQEHGSASVPHRAAAADLTAALHPAEQGAAVKTLVEAGPGEGTHVECVAVHELLAGKLQSAAAAEEWRRRCAEMFRWSRRFGGPDCVPLQAAAGQENGAAAGEDGVERAAQGVAQLALA